MASPEQGSSEAGRRIPWQQILMDDIFLLVMFGMVIPTFIYIIWGLMSLGDVPIYVP
ncbi:MAG: hypothetical protein U0556_04475 [Dehalococcoidia bacterium]